MRALALWALLAAPALAQPTSPEDLAFYLGSPWVDVATRLPTPQASTISDGVGAVRWADLSGEFSHVDADVRDGRLERVVLVPSAEAWPGFKEVAAMMRARVGPPGSDGFYSWSDIVAASTDPDAPPEDVQPFDAMFSVAKGYAVMRAAEPRR